MPPGTDQLQAERERLAWRRQELLHLIRSEWVTMSAQVARERQQEYERAGARINQIDAQIKRRKL